MANNTSTRLRILSYVIAGYMLLAFSWWTILLLEKNKEVYDAKMLLIEASPASADFMMTTGEVEKEYKNQRLMIIGEGLVFILALLIGGWLINRGYNKEIEGIRQKRNFLLAITHELKSPLASIRLTLETFKKRKLSDADSSKLSDNALKETDRLTGLIDNLLLAAKLDKSYQPIFEHSDLLSIVHQVTIDLQHLFPEASFEIDSKLADTTLPIDRQGIYSSLYNLCENAIKYSQENPTVKISITRYGAGLKVDVADQGIGIAEDDKKKVFTQFYRVGNEETRRSTGTGLGLYIAEKMIHLHRGKISVVDNKPSGSIFSFTIPLNPQS